MNASCGVCGRSSLDTLPRPSLTSSPSWTVVPAVLGALPGRLVARQEAFAVTGGLHAAALATPDGDIVDLAEDVGRHNAVDKLVGRALRAGRVPLADVLLLVSGRTSFEIVQKAGLAGLPLVAAVSAPTSLAVELADEAGMTLVGFLRGSAFNVYSHPERIEEALESCRAPRGDGA